LSLPTYSHEFSSTRPTWTVRPIVELHWREWGDDSIVLEAVSTQVHRFDPLVSAVMACLEERSQGTADLVSTLAADLRIEVDAEFVDTIDSIVAHFRDLGWVEPIIGE